MLRAWLQRLGQQLIPLLIVAAVICGVATYAFIASDPEPLKLKPSLVWVIVAINGVVLAMLLGAIGLRIFQLWASMTAETSGSRLQKRVLLVFSLVTILPTIVVSIFSALFFNLGIQTWFNDRVQTAVSESLTVAEAYLTEHKENLRADAIAMASDLSRASELVLRDQAEFVRVVQAQSALRVLAESLVIYRNRIIAQGRLSFSLAFEHIPPEAFERARRGEAVILPSDEADKVRALVRIDGLEEGYLLVGRLVDSKVVGHMQN
ncbi:MAG: two-component sensor histidine kinase, partial [Bacteroidota bacterium]